MGITVQNVTKDRIGDQCWQLVAAAMAEKNIQMDYPSWEMAPGDVKEAYMPFVNQIVAYVESQPEIAPVKVVEPVIEEPEPVAENSFGASPAILEQLPGGGDMLEEPHVAEVVEKPVVDPLECGICGFSAATKGGLGAHKRFKHTPVPA